MRGLIYGMAAALTLLTAGCNFNTTTSESNAELNGQAEALYRELVAGQDDAIVARMSSENSPAQVRAQLPMLRRMIGSATPPTPTVSGTQTVRSTQGSFYAVGQDYSYADRLVHVETRFSGENDQWKVQAFNVNVRAKGDAAPMDGADEAPDAPSVNPDQSAGAQGRL